MSSSVIPVVVERKCKVVQLKRRAPARVAATLHQEDLKRAQVLARQITQAKRAYKKHVDFLERTWRGGAVVEPGELTIEEVLHRGGGIYVEKWEKPGIRVKKRKAS